MLPTFRWTRSDRSTIALLPPPEARPSAGFAHSPFTFTTITPIITALPHLIGADVTGKQASTFTLRRIDQNAHSHWRPGTNSPGTPQKMRTLTQQKEAMRLLASKH